MYLRREVHVPNAHLPSLYKFFKQRLSYTLVRFYTTVFFQRGPVRDPKSLREAEIPSGAVPLLTNLSYTEVGYSRACGGIFRFSFVKPDEFHSGVDLSVIDERDVVGTGENLEDPGRDDSNPVSYVDLLDMVSIE